MVSGWVLGPRSGAQFISYGPCKGIGGKTTVFIHLCLGLLVSARSRALHQELLGTLPQGAHESLEMLPRATVRETWSTLESPLMLPLVP